MNIKNPPLKLELGEKNFDLRLGGKSLEFSTRSVHEMLDVVMERETVSKMDHSAPLYFMYRAVKRDADAAIFGTEKMRYDVTVLKSVLLGKELNKTYGHYHENFNAKLTFPELYEVLEGEASYLLQKKKNSGEVGRVFLVRTRKGEKCIIPPNYGHATVNSGSGILAMDNINDAFFKSIYEWYKEKRGGAYYVLKEKTVANANYSGLPALEKMNASEFNALASKKLADELAADYSYSLFLKKPKVFEFLKNPSKVSWGV